MNKDMQEKFAKMACKYPSTFALFMTVQVTDSSIEETSKNLPELAQMSIALELMIGGEEILEFLDEMKRAIEEEENVQPLPNNIEEFLKKVEGS